MMVDLAHDKHPFLLSLLFLSPLFFLIFLLFFPINLHRSYDLLPQMTYSKAHATKRFPTLGLEKSFHSKQL